MCGAHPQIYKLCTSWVYENSISQCLVLPWMQVALGGTPFPRMPCFLVAKGFVGLHFPGCFTAKAVVAVCGIVFLNANLFFCGAFPMVSFAGDQKWLFKTFPTALCVSDWKWRSRITSFMVFCQWLEVGCLRLHFPAFHDRKWPSPICWQDYISHSPL